ncbi:acyltransferase [Winogradskyella sp.]|nr:acyltransferase [Winogradskyella sp.]MDA8874517.1 acyltransferase [Winogradskyella sp.]
MNYIKGFDALRAFSIILVLAAHLGVFSFFKINNDYFQVRVQTLLSGDTGVQIFFTLSGFLITTILIKQKNETKIGLKNFYIRRVLRLIPALSVFYIIVSSLMFFNVIEQNYKGLLYSIFYIYNYVPEHLYSGEIAHTWSLSLEEQFYIFWPIVLLLLKKIRYIVLVSISLIAISFVFVVFYLKYDSSAFPFMPFRMFVPGIGPIMIGSLFAIINFYYIDKIKSVLKKNNLIVIIFFVMFLYPLYSPVKIIYFTFLVHGISISCFLLWIFSNQKSSLVQALDNKYLNYIGVISYGIYLYQGIFLKTGPGGDNRLNIQLFPLNLILVIVLAIASYELMEKPILKLKKRFR